MQAAATLRSARRSANLTQHQLAARAGVPQSVIARLERPGSNPTLATLDRVLRATGHELRAVEAGREPAVDLDQLRRARGLDREPHRDEQAAARPKDLSDVTELETILRLRR